MRGRVIIANLANVLSRTGSSLDSNNLAEFEETLLEIDTCHFPPNILSKITSHLQLTLTAAALHTYCSSPLTTLRSPPMKYAFLYFLCVCSTYAEDPLATN